MYILGISGASGSGKTCTSTILKDKLIRDGKKITVISIDWFYKTMPSAKIEDGTANWDLPSAVNWDLFCKKIEELRSSQHSVLFPKYDYLSHSRVDDAVEIYNSDVLIVEGIMLFYDEKVRKMFDFLIYVYSEDDTCLGRRILRDCKERGRDVKSVLDQYFKDVKPGYEKYILPTKKYADVIIQNLDEHPSDKTKSIQMIFNHVKANF